jgi:2-alkyl-3-oxoalkanoate reductase
MFRLEHNKNILQVECTGRCEIRESSRRLPAVQPSPSSDHRLQHRIARDGLGEAALVAAGAALPWIVLRPPGVYGPGDRQTLAFFRWVSRGIGPVLGSGTGRVSLLYVDDLAAAVATAAGEGTACGLIGEPDDGQPGGHSWPAIMAAAAAELGVKVRLLRVPRSMLYISGVANGLLRLIPGYVPTLTPDKVRELYHHDWVCDATSMSEMTAWRPRTPIAAGFAAAIAWYRRHGWL